MADDLLDRCRVKINEVVNGHSELRVALGDNTGPLLHDHLVADWIIELATLHCHHDRSSQGPKVKALMSLVSLGSRSREIKLERARKKR